MKNLKLLSILALLFSTSSHAIVTEQDRDLLGTDYQYLVNGGCEAGKYGWATYSDGAASAPVDGTGGSPTVTIGSTTSSVGGKQSCLLTKPASNVQGQGWSKNFSVDTRALASELDVEIDGVVASGTYDSGTSTTDPDITAWVYGPTDGVLCSPSITALPIQLAPSKVIGTSPNLKFSGRFQTASCGTTYRLILHEAKTGTTAYTVAFKAKITRNKKIYGAPVTDWQSYTPAAVTWVSNTTYSGMYRRVGDSMEINGRVLVSGAPTAGNLVFSIPSGYLVDATKLAYSTAGDGGNYVGSGEYYDLSATSRYPVRVFLNSTTTSGAFAFQVFAASSAASHLESTVSDTVPQVWAAGDWLQFHAVVPIVGWASNLQMSSDSDGRTVGATYSTLSSTTVTANTALKFTTKVEDTHSAYDTSTGIYTVPVPGRYRITVSGINLSASVSDVELSLNGSLKGIFGALLNTGRAAMSVEYPFNAGDLVRINPDQSVTASGTLGWFSISRISGNTQVASTETVSAKYYQASSQSVSASTVTIVNFDTKVWDSHGAVTVGASWRFTSPVPGRYMVCPTVTSGNNSWSATNIFTTSVFKNGALQTGSTQFTAVAPSTATYRLMVAGCETVQLLKDEYVDVRVTQTPTAALFNGAGVFVSIDRIGNY